jgi:hypothetical protein
VSPPVGTTLGAAYASESRTAEPARALSSLVTAPLNTTPPPPPRNATPDPLPGWSFGDLLARASKEEEALANAQANQPAFSLNVSVIARALDAPAAEAIWARLRAGQRGIMVRSFYSPEGRVAFDEISRRAQTDADLQGTIGRYLADFEHILKDAEARDPTGRMLQHHLSSDTGRVYLFLAHASGRLT